MSTSPFVSEYGSIYTSFYFGVVLSTAIYGVTCMQTFFYYVHYPTDTKYTKSLVAAVWVLNTIHEALSLSGVYRYTMASLVNSSSLLVGIPELVLQMLPTAMVTVCTQGYFVYRIYVFSGKNIVMPLIWAVLATAQLVIGTMYVTKALYTANGLQVVSMTQLSESSFMTLEISLLAIAAAIDILIASFLTFLLVRMRTAATFGPTVNILQRLIVFAVNTGLWTAVFALLSLILLCIFQSKAYYVVVSVPLCPVYCNTFLANLNAKSYLLGGDTTYNVDTELITVSIPLVNSHIQGAKQGEEPERDPGPHQGIWKTTEVMQLSDANPWAIAEHV